MHHRVALLLIMLLSVLLASAQAAGRAQSGLFTPASAPATPPQRQPADAVRSRYVEVDLGLIVSADSQRLADQLTLNLFDDVTYTAIRQDSTALAPGRFTWVGRLAGVAESEITISVEDGVLAAGIAAGADFYTVRMVGDQRYRIDLLDQTVEQIDLEPLVPPASARRLPPVAAAQTPSAATIDVLVVWTPAARTAAGGLAAISALADLAVADTNAAYVNSNVAQRVQLVHKGEIAYTEQDMYTDLYLLTGKQGSANDPVGVMEEIHSLRDTYHADLVAMLVGYPGSLCGLAWHMTTLSPSFEVNGFSVVNSSCAAAPQNSFAHELGHNMGLAHDRQNATGSVFPYAYGYRVPGQFRTVMAYNCSPSCPRVRHFGNPNVLYNGMPTGTQVNVPEPAYEALALDNTAATVAAFRQNLNAYQQYLPQVVR